MNWCEFTLTDPAGRVLYHNAWATSRPIDQHGVIALVAAARSRWKIEDEHNNTLKTQGYHFEHNYGYGCQHLAALLATLILLPSWRTPSSITSITSIPSITGCANSSPPAAPSSSLYAP